MRNISLIAALACMVLVSLPRHVVTAEEPKEFKYAGVIAYSVDPDTRQLVVLLGKEHRGRRELKFCPGLKWKGIGGTRDGNETTVETASREFDQETGVDAKTGKGAYGRGFLLKPGQLNPELRIKHPRHKSYIYLVEVPYKKIGDFPDERDEVKQLAWVPASELYAAIDAVKKQHPGRFPDGMIKGRCFAQIPKNYVGEDRDLYPPLVDELEGDTLFRKKLKVPPPKP
ncbi:NUDIX hydrolase [Gimesia aquarii]|uniref:NUDIX domain protein n=1 Tax=Gimesia aquarii TaxID=2527964 RepID=A0A517X0K0_9PLAN|nr:NUDIX hydrolase [Gimesia aquarii]QDU11036.1 NUDIX domain protein [Gimesia aquarii]